MIRTDRIRSIVFKEQVNFTVRPGMGLSGGGSGQIWCDKELSDLLDIGELENTMALAETNPIYIDRGEAFIRSCKPIKPLTAVIHRDFIELRVEGQKSSRIRSKWGQRYAEILGVPVKLAWVTEYANYSCIERGGGK